MNKVKRNTDPAQGPLDGVELDTDCVVTQYEGTGKSKRIARKDMKAANMKCSFTHGTLTITDRGLGGLSVTVRIQDLSDVIRSAYEASEGGGQGG